MNPSTIFQGNMAVSKVAESIEGKDSFLSWIKLEDYFLKKTHLFTQNFILYCEPISASQLIYSVM